MRKRSGFADALPLRSQPEPWTLAEAPRRIPLGRLGIDFRNARDVGLPVREAYGTTPHVLFVNTGAEEDPTCEKMCDWSEHTQ